MKKKKVHVFNPSYEYEYIVMLNYTDREANGYSLRRFGVSPKFDRNKTAGASLEINKGQKTVTLIWIPEFRMTPRHISTLAHEATHAALFTFHTIKQEISDGSNEFVCYLVDQIVREVLEGYLKLPSKKRGKKNGK